jgi:plastocyanin
MHITALFRPRPVLLGGLALVAVASAPITHAAPIADQSVSINSFAFAPAELSVPVGATLTWSNAQVGVPHTSSSVDGLWDSGVLSTGDTFSFTFNQVGDFAYQCDIHPSMRGIVHVDGDASTDAGTTVATDSAGPQAPAAPASTAQSVATPTGQPPAPVATSVPSSTPTVLAPAVTPTAPPAPNYGY